ncbi:hypothetical protein PSU4_34480 [Pseudonocardia sulfidoxydans NBRC 16205]|uniref:Uncharacterized protein n=1 Tax=Pseudonocardia sulfidoxydans NBRC 16205 TaxID=1223511 RepID=A0A511DL39_9PSEU|nr:hypothetical protein [Pseudonocardia sulfidoxydans]GEL24494.1 hypothetical protein PSU4_34480 [Pseudonocardia sulfidoxydans NBRC 16205]
MSAPTIAGAETPTTARRRGGLLLAALGVLTSLLLIGLVSLLLGLGADPEPAPAPAPGHDPFWDLAAETALATRAMPRLPDSAAQPHTLSTRTPAGAITLPTGPFPATPEGALAQLTELTRLGLQGADPRAYELAYDAIAEPGAPQVESTVLHRGLVRIRAAAGLPRTGAAPELAMRFTPMAGLVKGTADGGRYVVACVLGQVDVVANGIPISSGGADCQAMRRIGDTWRISPGAQAAAATVAWPGTDEALDAGYLPLGAI